MTNKEERFELNPKDSRKVMIKTLRETIFVLILLMIVVFMFITSVVNQYPDYGAFNVGMVVKIIFSAICLIKTTKYISLVFYLTIGLIKQ